MRDDPFWQAMERAAEKLPHGYVVSINVEKDAAWVSVRDPGGDDVPLHEGDGDETYAEKIDRGLACAIAHFIGDI